MKFIADPDIYFYKLMQITYKNEIEKGISELKSHTH